MTKRGGTQESFSGSVASRLDIPGCDRQQATIMLLVLLLFALSVSSAQLWAVDGDPSIDVPTIQQGRAILARDMLHQQCELARQAQDWQRLDRFAKQALVAEQRIFGTDFSGSVGTMRYQGIADFRLGNKLHLARQAEQELAGFKNESQAEVHSQSFATSAEALVIEGQVSGLISIAALFTEFDDVAQNALITGDYSDFDAKIPALYEATNQWFESHANNTKQNIGVGGTSELDEFSRDQKHFLAITALFYSQAQQRKGDETAARSLARQAFSHIQEVNEFWEFDTQPNIGGRAIGEHLLTLLHAELLNQRRSGNWILAYSTAEKMMPIARKLGDPLHEVVLLAEEAKLLSKLPVSDQAAYANTVREQGDFETAIGNRLFGVAIDIGVQIADERIRILGPDCMEAAKINRKLGYLYWTQEKYANAFARLLDAVHVFAKKVPESDPWFRGATSDLYVNARLVAESEDGDQELPSRLKDAVEEMSKRLGDEHFVVAEGRLCLQHVQHISAMSEHDKRAFAAFSSQSSKRNSLYSNGRFAEAAQMGKSLVEQAKDTFGEPSAQHLDNLRAYANCLAKSGNADESVAIYRDLLDQYDRTPFNRTSDFHWVYHGMANTLRDFGTLHHDREALQWLAKARKRVSETLGNQSAYYATHLSMEGEILRDNLYATAQALSKFQEANAIFESIYGNQDSFDYCQGLVQVGLCENDLQLWDAAEQHLKLAMKIRKRNHYENPHMTVWNLWALGTNSFDRREYEDAVKYFSEALAIEERETPAATAIASHYGNILVASVLQDQGGDQAQRVLHQFLDRRKAFHVDDPEAFADECRNAAQWLFDNPSEFMKSDMTEEGQAILEELVAAGLHSYQSAGVSNDWRILELKWMKGGAAEMLGQREQALSIFRNVLQQTQALTRPRHELIAYIHNSLSKLYQKEHSLDLALTHRRIARDAIKLAFGEKSMQFAYALNGEANVLLALGDYARAEKLTQDAAQISTNSGHPMRAKTYQQLARIHWLREDFDLAEQYLYAARAHLDELGFGRELDLEIRMWLSKLMLVKGEFSLAWDSAEHLRATASDSLDTQLILSARSIQGIARLGLGKNQEAYTILKEVLEQAEDDPRLQISTETHAAYAAACARIGHRQEANSQFRLLFDQLVRQHEVYRDVLSERQRLELRSKIHQATGLYLSHAIESDTPLSGCYETIMPLKGLVFAKGREQRMDGEAMTSEHHDLSQQIDRINRELSSLLFGSDDSDPKQSVNRIGKLTGTAGSTGVTEEWVATDSTRTSSITHIGDRLETTSEITESR